MSKYSTVDSKFRSFSPQYFSQSPSETGSLFEKHRDLMHQQISQLPNSPKSKKQLEQTFEEMLKSIHFFRKPDIIPFPYLNFEKNSEEKSENQDSKYKDLVDALENEKNARKIAEKENANLKDRIMYLLDIEKQYEEYRLKTGKINDLYEEIEKLNIRIKLLLDENEDLRKKHFRASNFKSHESDLEKEVLKNKELLKELQEIKEAYEELRKAYARDVNSLKEKFDKLYSEKMRLELQLRNRKDQFQRPERENFEQPEENSIQDKIRSMKNEYRDKLKNLEQRLNSDRPDDMPDSRIKVIEDRIAKIQEAIESTNGSEKPIQRQKFSPKRTTPSKSARSRGSTPTREKIFTPSSTWQTIRNASKSPPGYLRNLNTNRPKSRASENSPLNPKRNGLSPHRNLAEKSPDSRSASRKRLYENHAECETCIKRHGHEWAKSPR